MSIRRNNNLTRFIKKMLENSDAQQWNTPPDSLFENAMVEVAAIEQEKKRKKRRGAAIVLLAAGILLTSGFFIHEFYQMNQKIENLEVMMAAEDSDIPVSTTSQSESAQREISEANDNSSSDHASADFQESNASVSHMELSGVSNSKIEDKAIATSNLRRAHPVGQEMPGNAPVLNSKASITGGAANTHSRTRSMATVEPREGVYFPRLTGLDETQAMQTSFALTPELVEPSLGRSRNLAIDLSMTSNFSTLVMNGEGGQAVITEYDKYYCGLGLSAGIEYKFGARWSAVIRASFSQWNNHSRSQSNHIYNSANETIDQAGNPMYSTSGMIETPLGDHETILSFYTSSLTTQDGDLITYMTDIDQSINVLSTSIGGRYTPLNIGRTDLFVGLGADFTHELNSSNDMRTETYMEDKLLAALEERTQVLRKHEVNYFSLYGEIGARVFLGEKIDLMTTLRYTRSLSSLRTADANEPRTFLSQFSPSIGVNYYIH